MKSLALLVLRLVTGGVMAGHRHDRVRGETV